MQPDPYVERRHRLVADLRAAGIRNEAVLAAIENTPRHRFVDSARVSSAYEDRALPIAHGQTISQPYIVALMTGMLLGGGDAIGEVLEIGTGCGYQTAVLAQLASRVYTVERIAALQRGAEQLVTDLGFSNVEYLTGDGFHGWEERQPFEGIIVTAAPAEVPPRLLEQLAPGGRLVIPVGDESQHLRVIMRTVDGFEEQCRDAVRFVPMLPGVSG